MGCNADTEPVTDQDVVEQIAGEAVVARWGRTIDWRIASQRKDVLDSSICVIVENRRDLCTRMSHTCQMGHGSQLGLRSHPGHEILGALTCTAARTIRDTDETWLQRFELCDHAPQRGLSIIGLGRKELEGKRPTPRKEIGDASHWPSVEALTVTRLVRRSDFRADRWPGRSMARSVEIDRWTNSSVDA
jgi:hypothetical protein